MDTETVASSSNYSYDWNCPFNSTCDVVYRHGFGTGLVLCSGYVLVFALGLIGNSFVIAVVFRTPRMRTVTNYFIVNLAVADILVIVFCLPVNLMSNIYVPWMLGWFMCKSFTYVQTVSVSASVNSLVAVSLDRFLAIWFPLRPQITKRTARTLLVLIWIKAAVVAVPMAVFFDLTTHDATSDLVLCFESWPSERAEKLYFLIAHLLLCYLLPLKLISAFYIMIWIKVARRSIPGEGDSRDGTMRAIQQKSKVKVVKMLAVVVLIFMLSWLPLYVIFVRIKLGWEISDTELRVLEVVTPIAQWLGVSNSCINPILYAFFNKKFRSGFVAIIKSRTCCGTLRNEACLQSTVRRPGAQYPSQFQSMREERTRNQQGILHSSSSKAKSFNSSSSRSRFRNNFHADSDHEVREVIESRLPPTTTYDRTFATNSKITSNGASKFGERSKMDDTTTMQVDEIDVLVVDDCSQQEEYSSTML